VDIWKLINSLFFWHGQKAEKAQIKFKWRKTSSSLLFASNKSPSPNKKTGESVVSTFKDCIFVKAHPSVFKIREIDWWISYLTSGFLDFEGEFHMLGRGCWIVVNMSGILLLHFFHFTTFK
jgi:hypothetical protein